MGDDACIPLSSLAIRITKGTTPTTLGRPFVSQGVNFVKSEAIRDGRIEPAPFGFIDQETHELLGRSQLQEHDVLFSMAGVYLGKTAVVQRAILPANTNQAVGIIRLDRSKANPRFVHYVLSSAAIQSWIHRSVAQSAQPNFNLGEIGRLPIPALSVKEQAEIAGVLGALDDKIDLNRKMNATFEALARALFKSWFVDFDPVRAKAEGRDTGLPPEIAALFPEAFEDSERGEIPKGWDVGLVSKVADVASGKRPPDRYPIKTPEHSIEVWGGNGPIAYTIEPLLNEPALLTGRVGTLGSVFRVSRPIWPSDNTLVVRPHEPFFEYTFFVLRGIDYRSLNRGSTQPLLTQGDLKNQKIMLPSQAVVRQFSMTASVLFARTESAAKESAILASLRDALLPKLISGEIRVSDADRIVEQSA